MQADLRQTGLPNFQALALAVCRMLQKQGLTPSLSGRMMYCWRGVRFVGFYAKLPAPAGERSSCRGRANLNSSAEDLSAAGKPATSMAQVAGRAYDLQTVMECFLGELHEVLAVFFRQGFPGIYDAMRDLFTGLDRTFCLQTATGGHIGRIAGINRDGTLLFDCQQCGRMTVHSGELSTGES